LIGLFNGTPVGKKPKFYLFIEFGILWLHGEILRVSSDVQKHDRPTDKNSTFLAAPAAGEIRAPPNLAW